MAVHDTPPCLWQTEFVQKPLGCHSWECHLALRVTAQFEYAVEDNGRHSRALHRQELPGHAQN